MASYETRRGVYIAAIVLITLFSVLTFSLVCRVVYLRHFATSHLNNNNETNNNNNNNYYNDDDIELEKQSGYNKSKSSRSIFNWIIPWRRYKNHEYLPITNNNTITTTSTTNTVPSIYLTTDEDDDSSKVLVAHISESGAACWRTPTATTKQPTTTTSTKMDELDLDTLGGLTERF